MSSDAFGVVTAPTGTLHHIELYVSDLQRSTGFWGWLLEGLGYAKYQEWPAGVSWRLGATYIVLVQADPRYLHDAQPPYHRCRPGLNHLAFHVASREDVDRWTAALRERGVRILYEDRHPHAGGTQSCAVFFEDPDRMKVELACATLA